MKKSILIIVLFCALAGYAQDKKARKYAETITTGDLYDRLAVLASDSLEGRETGTIGQKKAADYIADQFAVIGLKPPVRKEGGTKSYYQSFNLFKSQWHKIYVRNEDTVFNNLGNIIYYSRVETMGEEKYPLVFVGDASDLNKFDTKGKFVVTTAKDVNSIKSAAGKAEPAGFMIVNENTEELQFSISRFRPYYERASISKTKENTGDKIFIVDTTVVRSLFDKKYNQLAKGDETTFFINADKHIEEFETENVLGYLEGSEKPEELIVITSHYDHLGKRDSLIYNGADDDGSGTTSLIEIAEAFSTAKEKGSGPDRSILFMCVTGEEKGLLGSEHYTENPVFPLEKTVANLNIDMVGRVDEKHAENPNYIYLIGSDKLSTELHELSEEVNKNTVDLELDYTYNDENDPNRYYYRSDHYNFAKNNIPIIFYFNGTHADYHKPTDTIEKIEFDKMQKIAKLVYFTAWEIANREDRIMVDKEEK